MRKIVLALAVVSVVLFAAYWLMYPTGVNLAPPEIAQQRMADPAFRAELAAEERAIEELAREEARAATRPTTRSVD